MAATDVRRRQLVVFSLGSERYGLPIERVHEIIRFTKPRSVSSHARSMVGVISLRGKIVPVCNLAGLLGHGSLGAEDTKIVIVDSGRGAITGVMVDQVEEVLTVDDSAIEPVPGNGADHLTGIVRIGDRLVVILDPDTLLDEVAA